MRHRPMLLVSTANPRKVRMTHRSYKTDIALFRRAPDESLARSPKLRTNTSTEFSEQSGVATQ